MHVMFPHQIMRQAARFRVAGQSIASQVGISGAVTVKAAMGARWEASLSFVLRDEAQHLALRAFLAGMEGELGTTDVPAHSRFRPYDGAGHRVAACDVAGLADGQTWEHFGFPNAPLESATLAEAADLRATRIKVDYSNSTGLRPGQRFAIGNRLHEVQLAWVDAAGDNVLQIQPPLRAAVAAGTLVELHQPRCLMRLADASGPAYDDLNPRMQAVTLQFVEAI